MSLAGSYDGNLVMYQVADEMFKTTRALLGAMKEATADKSSDDA
jgi:hypothetical protein